MWHKSFRSYCLLLKQRTLKRVAGTRNSKNLLPLTPGEPDAALGFNCGSLPEPSSGDSSHFCQLKTSRYELAQSSPFSATFSLSVSGFLELELESPPPVVRLRLRAPGWYSWIAGRSWCREKTMLPGGWWGKKKDVPNYEPLSSLQNFPKQHALLNLCELKLTALEFPFCDVTRGLDNSQSPKSNLWLDKNCWRCFW